MSLVTLLTGLLVAGVAFSAAPPATGQTDPPASTSGFVDVSGDGLAYSAQYTGLFDGDILVPEGTATDSFVVRNDGATPGYLRVILTKVVVPSRDVLNSLAISASSTPHPGEFLPVSGARPCLTLLTGQRIAPGQSVRVNSVLALGNLTATDGQGIPISFRLQVLLSESVGQNAVGCPVAVSSPSVPSGHLASTGFTGLWGSVAGGVSLMTVGAALALWHNRRSARRRGNEWKGD